MKRDLYRSERGLTLVEIMVVLIIIGLMWAAFGKKLFGAGDKMKAQLTSSMLTQLKGDIEQFKLRYNKLPTSLRDLTECNEVTGPGCVPITNSDALKDSWGNDFRYETNGKVYKIKTLGADGQDGGEGVDYDRFEEGP